MDSGRGNADTHARFLVNAYSDSNSNDYTNAHAIGHTYGHSDYYSDSNAYSDSDADTYFHGYRYPKNDTEATPDFAASPHPAAVKGSGPVVTIRD